MSLSDVGRRVAEVFDPESWAAWFASLDRGFAFLLLLPFIVAVVGLWSSYLRGGDEEGGREEDRER